MEDIYYSMNDLNHEQNEFSLKKDLPESSINKYSYDELLQLNKEYNKQLSNKIENLVIKKRKLILPKKDMKVINNLLLENFKYLIELIPKVIYTVEFDNIYSISLSILNALSQMEVQEIKIYQKLQKLKFLQLKLL